MVLHRKRRLFLGLGVTVTLGLVVVLPPAAAAVSTLTGQTLNGSSSSANSPTCPAPTYSVSGTASGPYPGTFDESGTWNFEELTSGTFGPATFAITSGSITISGSKSGRGVGFRECAIPGRGGGADLSLAPIAYTATIHTPNGNFHDEGTSAVNVSITGSGAATLTESFTSSLTAPVLSVPTSKAQCKKGGWRDYPQFKNQGSCVRFVVTGKPPVAQHQSSTGRSKAPGRGNGSKASK